MQVVDQLGDIRHVDLVGVPIKRVERERRTQRIAQAALLLEQVPGASLLALDGELEPV